MNTKSHFGLLTVLLVSASADAALINRGGGMIYDTVQDITWLQDAGYIRTSGYQTAVRAQYPAAAAWADQLVYGGYDDWRLPGLTLLDPENVCTAYDGSCDEGFNATNGEMGHLFYVTLGNVGDVAPDGTPLVPDGSVTTTYSFVDGLTGETFSFQNVQSLSWYGNPATNSIGTGGLPEN